MSYFNELHDQERAGGAGARTEAIEMEEGKTGGGGEQPSAPAPAQGGAGYEAVPTNPPAYTEKKEGIYPQL